VKRGDERAARTGTVWAFLVVSSDGQAESLPFQRQWATRTAAENGWSVTDTFEAVSSGRDGIRGLLETLLKKLRSTPANDRPERVLMTRLDRLGRGGLEPLAAFAEISKLGVKIFTRQDGDYQLARASDSILPMMRIITGAIENEARIDKALSAYDRRRRAGLVVATRRPYGLRLEKGHDVPDGERAAVVAKAFELTANGFGLYAIGKRLTQVAPPHEYRNGRVHVVEWTSDRVRKLLGTESYRTTIVDDALWTRAHAVRAGSTTERSETKNPYPLSGALTCECGRRLVGSIRGSNVQRVYRCRARTLHGRIVTHSAPRLENAFAALISDLSASPELIERYATAQRAGDDVDVIESALKRARAAVAGTERERERAWELNEAGNLRDEDLQTRLDAVQRRAAEAAAEITLLSREIEATRLVEEDRSNAASVLERASRLWELASVDDRKAIAKAVTRAVGGLTVTLAGDLEARAPNERSMFQRPSPPTP